MAQIIVYKMDGGCFVMYPTAEALATLTIEEVAKKDVPAGVPYRIITEDELESLLLDAEPSDGAGGEPNTPEGDSE